MLRVCHKCGKEPLTGDEIGLNFKLINRAVEKFLCMRCLGAEFNIQEDKLLAQIERFRAAGCSMFPPKASLRDGV